MRFERPIVSSVYTSDIDQCRTSSVRFASNWLTTVMMLKTSRLRQIGTAAAPDSERDRAARRRLLSCARSSLRSFRDGEPGWSAGPIVHPSDQLVWQMRPKIGELYEERVGKPRGPQAGVFVHFTFMNVLAA